LADFVVAFKCNFYFSVPEEVCNFPDLWGYIGECHPLGVAFGSSGWVMCGLFFVVFFCLLFLSVLKLTF